MTLKRRDCSLQVYERLSGLPIPRAYQAMCLQKRTLLSVSLTCDYDLSGNQSLNLDSQLTIQLDDQAIQNNYPSVSQPITQAIVTALGAGCEHHDSSRLAPKNRVAVALF